MVKADIGDQDTFRPHLVGIVSAEMPDAVERPERDWIGDYELHVSHPGVTETAVIFRLD